MKILWFSVKPTISSGYGMQTALWVPALKAAGHDISIACSVGLFSSVEMWNGIRLYPHSNYAGNYGTDIVVEHAKRLESDIVWSWLDAFILRPDECKKVNWVAWVPADSDPLMVRNVESLKACRFVVAPTRFGQRVIREAGIPNVMYVPCAFDPKVMFQSKEDRGVLRERFGKLINRDLTGKYLVNVVAANSGKRKNFPAIFEAWKMFYAKHSDAILYLHTEITGKWADGENLAELMKLYDIDDNSVLFVSQYHYNTGQIGTDYLNLLYNVSDVHLNTCVGEGFGLPIMDAQACFPAGTEITVSDPYQIYERVYTGDLYTITTDKGIVQATAEHPFATEYGWRTAKELDKGVRLLYINDNSKHKENCHEQKGIYKGRIENVVKTLRQNAPSGSCKENEQDIQFRSVAKTRDGVDKNISANNPHEECASVSLRFGLHSWSGRRRGNNYDSEYMRVMAVEKEVDDFSICGEHKLGIDGLAERQTRMSECEGRNHTAQRKSGRVLSIQNVGIGIFAFIQKIVALSHNQTGSGEIGNSVDRNAVGSTIPLTSDSTYAGDDSPNSLLEYQTILKIERLAVKDLTVYNFGTSSGVYLAEGFLVHNCGCPTIVPDFAGAGEIGFGLKITKGMMHPLVPGGLQFLVDPKATADGLEEAYSYRGDENWRAEMVLHSEDYSLETIMEKYMKPVLEKIEGEAKK